MEHPTFVRMQKVFGDARNADAFRLAIVGFAKLEDALNDALNEAFGGELPSDLRYTPFRVRVALAEALGLMPAVFRDPLGRLKALRDKFAHGNLDEMSESQGLELYAAARDLFPELETQVPALKNERQPEIHLANLLLVLELGLEDAFAEARDARRQQDAAMREWWERRAPTALSAEQIRELLTNEQEEAPTVKEHYSS